MADGLSFRRFVVPKVDIATSPSFCEQQEKPDHFWPGFSCCMGA
jgi:hypothetical protein